MIQIYPIVPVSAPRQTRRDAFNPSDHVKRYRAFRDEVRLRGVKIPTPYYHVLFALPMPKSWSDTQCQELYGTPHKQRPDRDNLEKALLDAVHAEDGFIHDGRTTKLWSNLGFIVIDNCDLWDSDEPVGFNLDSWENLARSMIGKVARRA